MAFIDKDIIKRIRHNSMHDAEFERIVETFDSLNTPVAKISYIAKSGDTRLLMCKFIRKQLDKQGRGTSFREDLIKIKDQPDFNRFCI